MSLLLTGFERLAEISINMWLGGVGGGYEVRKSCLKKKFDQKLLRLLWKFLDSSAVVVSDFTLFVSFSKGFEDFGVVEVGIIN